jgi:hypothetical protein
MYWDPQTTLVSEYDITHAKRITYATLPNIGKSQLTCVLRNILRFSDYPHLTHLDHVTIAILPAFFDLTILSILHQTMAYASSVHNNLDSPH